MTYLSRFGVPQVQDASAGLNWGRYLLWPGSSSYSSTSPVFTLGSSGSVSLIRQFFGSTIATARRIMIGTEIFCASSRTDLTTIGSIASSWRCHP